MEVFDFYDHAFRCTVHCTVYSKDCEREKYFNKFKAPFFISDDGCIFFDLDHFHCTLSMKMFPLILHFTPFSCTLQLTNKRRKTGKLLEMQTVQIALGRDLAPHAH